jgi:hypothetical protein
VQQLFAVIVTSHPQLRNADYSHTVKDGKKETNTIIVVPDTV